MNYNNIIEQLYSKNDNCCNVNALNYLYRQVPHNNYKWFLRMAIAGWIVNWPASQLPCSANNVDDLYQPVYVHVQVMMGLSKVHLKPEQNNLQRLEYIPVL